MDVERERETRDGEMKVRSRRREGIVSDGREREIYREMREIMR